MKFTELPLKGAYIIDLDKIEDERGFFARYYCKNEYELKDLNTNIVQINNSYCKHKATLRGIHYQLPPKAENKIVRCIRGSFCDIIIDLRKESPTFGKWHGEELSCDNRRMLYIPEGFGHSFITLEDDTETLYLVTEFYAPAYERTIRWDDPELAIDWPIEPKIISDKDRNASYFDYEFHLGII